MSKPQEHKRSEQEYRGSWDGRTRALARVRWMVNHGDKALEDAEELSAQGEETVRSAVANLQIVLENEARNE